MKYKKTKLKNGLRIITAPMKETETVTVIIMVGAGSRYESEKQAGISHFLEHILFKGTEKRPSAMAVAEELDSFGGESNAFTGKSRTAYYVKVDSRHLDQALDIISDIYLNAKIDEEDVEREKGTIIQEINMFEDTPMRRVDERFEDLLYKGNSLGKDILGYKKTVSKIKSSDLRRYMKKTYLSKNTVVCVSGKIKPREVISRIEGYFSKMNSGKKPVLKKVKENQKKPAVSVSNKKTDQTHLVLGVRAYGQNHKDKYALGILSIILGGNMSSRMFMEVREKRGLAYYIRTGTESYQDVGYLATQAGVDNNNLEKTIKVILNEYKKISENPVDKKELKRAKDYLKGKSVMGLESSDDVAMFLIDQEVRKGKIMTIKEIFSKINKVTEKDIYRVARDIFKKGNLNLAVIGPHKSKVKLQKILNSYG